MINILLAFVLTSCFGEYKAKTKDIGKNRKPLTVPVTATERNNASSAKPTNNVNNNDLEAKGDESIYDIFEAAEALVAEGKHEEFAQLLKENLELLNVRLVKESARGTSLGNNILHMIVDKADTKSLFRFLDVLLEADNYKFVELAYSANDKGILPKDLKVSDGKLITLQSSLIKALDFETMKDAVKKGNIELLKNALDIAGKDFSTRLNIFGNKFYDEDDYQKDLLYLAVENNRLDIMTFLVTEIEMDVEEEYSIKGSFNGVDLKEVIERVFKDRESDKKKLLETFNDLKRRQSILY